MPDLLAKEYYPSLSDVRPMFQYSYCSTPQQRDHDEPKQVKSQTYSSDILAMLTDHRSSDVTMSTQNVSMNTVAQEPMIAFRNSSPFCPSSDSAAEADPFFEVRVSDPIYSQPAMFQMPMMMPCYYGTTRNASGQADGSVYMQFERVSDRNAQAAIQDLARELEQRSSDQLAQQDTHR